LSFGAEAEVLKPEKLRKEILDELNAAKVSYTKQQGETHCNG